MYEYDYKMPTDEVLSDDIAANLAFFLYENTGTVLGSFYTRLRAPDQRKLFRGEKPLGRRGAHFDGNTEIIYVFRSVCFGTDYDCQLIHFNQL